MTDRTSRFFEPEPGAGLSRGKAQCHACRHYHRITQKHPCDAFPGGIPEAIWLGRHDHRQPYPGDHGIRFEPLPGERHPAEEGDE